MRIEEGKTYRAASGEKVGPMMATGTIFVREFGDGFSWNPDGTCYVAGSEEPEGWNLVSEWTEHSPVRTITRQEIFPGTYDGVVVMGVDPGGELHVSLIPMATRDPDRLERAAAVLTALAGALRDGE